MSSHDDTHCGPSGIALAAHLFDHFVYASLQDLTPCVWLNLQAHYGLALTREALAENLAAAA